MFGHLVSFMLQRSLTSEHKEPFVAFMNLTYECSDSADSKVDHSLLLSESEEGFF